MRRAELGRKFLHTGIVLLVALFFVQCDKEDDYVYPDVLTDFMDLHTNDESVIDYIRPDVSGMLSLNHRLSGQGLKEDTVYRAVGMYSLPDAEGRTSVYSVSLVYAEPPVRLGEGLTLLADPLNIESVYRGGDYLNVVAQPMMQSIPHSYTFAEDSLVSKGGCTRLYLKLGHSRNGDRESFSRRVYLSVPLKGYALSAGDTIVFRANVYDKGLKEWRVAY